MKTPHSTTPNLNSLPAGIRWKLAMTRIFMVWERIWSALWPASGFVGVYLVLSLLDLWSQVPGLVQTLALLATLGGAGSFFWRQISQTRWPTPYDALRRLERESGLDHRPLTTLDDQLVQQHPAASTQDLWALHLKAQREKLSGLRMPWPRSDLAARDPNAFRSHILLFVLVAGLLAGSDWQSRLGLALQPSFSLTTGNEMEVTAWVNPPAFTGMAPLFLTSDMAGETIVVPEQSDLVVRVANARGRPFVKQPSGLPKVVAAAGPKSAGTKSGALSEVTLKVTEGGLYRLKDRGRTLDSWRFSVTPDAAPYVAFDDLPHEGEKNELLFSYILTDDYGFEGAHLHLDLVTDALKEREDGLAPEGGSLDVSLPLAGDRKDFADEARFNLTDHPFAGLDVEGTLVAKDLGGHVATSKTARFTLPDRDFFEPLALAIVEQRRNLVRDPTDWAYVMKALEALTLAPEYFFDDLTVYMGMRTAYWQLDRLKPQDRAQILPTAELLWDLALHVEDGSLALAERELRAVAEALKNALARGAPMDEIQRLLQRYQEALERYLAALAEKQLAEGAQGDTPQPPGDVRTLTDQDLKDLLKAIEDLARTGDEASARDLLAELQKMLENMTLSQGQGSSMNGPESELSKQIEGLSDLIGKERSLMDETLRRSEGGEGESPDLPGLAEEQEALREDLDGIEPGPLAGEEATGALGEAEEAMQDAERALREGDAEGAMHAQRRAIDRMREAAEGMAENLMKSMAERGEGGEGREGQVDPLGRPEGQGGTGFGDTVKVPEERDLQRAREILEELQKRAADPDRPKLELDYLERLLKRF